MSPATRNKILAILAIALGAIYLLNPTAGFLELIPDNIPFIGNLDEAGATALLLWGVQVMRRPAELPPPPSTR